MIHGLKHRRRRDAASVVGWPGRGGRYEQLSGPAGSTSSHQRVGVTRIRPCWHPGSSDNLVGVKKLLCRRGSRLKVALHIVTCDFRCLEVWSGRRDAWKTGSECRLWSAVSAIAETRVWRGWSRTKNSCSRNFLDVPEVVIWLSVFAWSTIKNNFICWQVSC